MESICAGVVHLSLLYNGKIGVQASKRAPEIIFCLKFVYFCEYE